MAVSAVKKEAAKNPAAAATAAAPAPAPIRKKRGKHLKLFIILAVIGSLGGAAYWYLTQHRNGNPSEAKPQPAKPPIFVPLEAFTVNLQLEESPMFLQTGLSLKVADSTVVDALKLHMPEVRDRILLLLSSRKASELLTVDGKRKLSSDIVAAINAILAPPAPSMAPEIKAPQESQPPADGEAAAPVAGEEKPVQETAAPAAAPAVKSPVLNVLFTSFIVQ